MAHQLSPREAELAAGFQADVGIEHIAGVYAEAFLGAASEAGRTEDLLAEFASFLADVLDQFPKLEKILASGLIPPDDKTAILDRALGTQASRMFLNFLKVLVRRGRFDLIRHVHRQARALNERRRGRVRVQVVSAAPLDADLAARITQGIRGLVPGEPALETVVDPELIGGVVVRVGDIVYDGSVATQLERIRQKIVERSVHEIQSRRDRFRDPARD